MEAEKNIAQIEWLEELFRLPDERTSRMVNWKLGNQRRSEDCATDLRFRLRRRDDK
jgi:hypothetical protein